MRSDVSFLFLFNFNFNIFACSKNSADPGKHHFTFFTGKVSMVISIYGGYKKAPS